MFTGVYHDYPLTESKAHFDPRRYDPLGERWIFRAPALDIPSIAPELPNPLGRFQVTPTAALRVALTAKDAGAT